MTTERRAHARGKTSVDVAYNDATGETSHSGKLYDLGRGGMFVATDKPIPIGKRIEFEVKASEGTVAGMGRVIWVRESAVNDAPAGMGIKFIDVDDDAMLTIDRISGLKKNVRERTVLGMMAPTAAAPEKKIESPVRIEQAAPKKDAPRPARERTVLGLGVPVPTKQDAPPAAPSSPMRDAELSWPDEPPDAPPEPAPEPVVLAPTPAAAPAPVHEPAPTPAIEPEPEEPVVAEAKAAPEPEPAPAAPVKHEPSAPKVAKATEPSGTLPIPRELPPRRRGGRGWLYIVLLVVIGGMVAAYLFRDQILPPPVPAPSASASTSASAPAASVSAQASASASASAEVVVADAAAAPIDTNGVAPADEAGTNIALDGGIHDGGHHDHDAGHHDAGHIHDGGHPAAKPKPKPSATEDNPY